MKRPSEQYSEEIYPSITDELLAKISRNDASLRSLIILTSTDESVQKLAAAMRNNAVITKLVLHGNLNAKERCLGCSLKANRNVGHSNALTNRSASLLLQCTSLQTLDLNCNNIDDEGLRILAQSQSLRKLSMIGCPITEAGINALLQNQFIEDFKYYNHNMTLSRRTSSMLESHLSINRERNNPSERTISEGKRERSQNEAKLQRAIKQQKTDEMNSIFAEENIGVDDKMEFGCVPLQYAVDEGIDRTALSLLHMGAKIEVVDRGYTPLFTAAESGKQSTSSALLSHGASLAGGFDFNPETPLSIAGFKFCDALLKQLSNSEIECLLDLTNVDDQKFIDMCLKNSTDTTYPKPWYLNYDSSQDLWHICCVSLNVSPSEGSNSPVLKSLNKVSRQDATTFPDFPWLNMPSVFIKKIIKFFSDMDDLWVNDGAPWINFARIPTYLDNVIIEAMIIYRNAKKHLPNAQNFAQLETLYNIYYEFHQKKAIATSSNKFYRPPTKSLSEQSMTIRPPVSTKLPKNTLTKAELQYKLDALNNDLKDHGFEGIDWSKYPSLYVADYRAIHYYGLYFTEAQRNDHSNTHQLNRIAPATAVFSMEGKSPAEHVLISEEVVDTDRQIILKTFEQFKEEGIEDDLHARMANDYEGYNKFTLSSNDSAATTLRQKKILKYPYYAASELPEHPLRYGYGLKPIRGLSNSRLFPNYDSSGKPANQTLGKVYGALYSPTQIFKHKKRSAIGKHNAQKMNLREAVAPEREVDVPGGALSEVLFYEEALTVPDFSQPYNTEYQGCYGLSPDKFKNIVRIASQQSNFHSEEFSEALLKGMIQYKRQDLIRKAQAEAKRRGGYLVYWDGYYTFSLEPQPVRPTQGLYNYEREMLQVGNERFESTGTLYRK